MSNDSNRESQPAPAVIETPLGAVEYAEFGEGPAVLALHGAMAKTLESRIPRAELLTIEGGEHVSIFTHRKQARDRGVPFLREH